MTPTPDPVSAPESLNLFDADAPKSSSLVKLGASVCAILLTTSLLFGYLFLSQRHNRQLAVERQAQLAAQLSPPAAVQIRENEARLKGSEAIISGTISNISNSKLEHLSLEFELRRRGAGQTETRRIAVTPSDLNPGEEGIYSFPIASKDWSSARILHLRNESNQAEIAFKTALGAKRPLESAPRNPKIVVVPRPKPKGGEFINTPDNPIPIK